MNTTSLNRYDVADEQYILNPGATDSITALFDASRGYTLLSESAKKHFRASGISAARSELRENHIAVQKTQVSEEDCQAVVSLMSAGDLSSKEADALFKEFIPRILTEDIVSKVQSYFQSEFAVLWYHFQKVESGIEDNVSKKWHCDGGPSEHLKLILYFDDSADHGSGTGFYSLKATEVLKKAGYIFTPLIERRESVDSLLRSLGVDESPNAFWPSTGDMLMFNPFKVAHRAIPPKLGCRRFCLTFCLIPAVQSFEKNLKTVPPTSSCIDFSAQVAKNLNQVCRDDLEAVSTLEQTDRDSKLSLIDSSEIIELSESSEIVSWSSLRHFLNDVFTDKEFTERLYDQMRAHPWEQIPKSLSELYKWLSEVVSASLDQALPQIGTVTKLSDLVRYHERYLDSRSRYSLAGKSEKAVVMWPNPGHEKYPSSRFDMTPTIARTPLLSRSTPIGSAGSCFAFEISKYLQREGFNYFIAERNDDPESGVIVDGYEPGDKYAKFSANYGIQFNSPSFTQLAEKAFGHRDFKKLLVRLPNGLYTDPYRENVFFRSKDAYLKDYPLHVEALRQTLLKCEVFILTLGLNECWQFSDGTAMSRNPKGGEYHLIDHKTLTVGENIAYVEQFIKIVRAYNPNFKVVLSVSPIPFLATGRGATHHVVEANTHSKAVLRVAAEELVANNEGVYYLPAYELVTQCSKDPWIKDDRHVSEDTVNRVMGMFRDIFVVEDEMTNSISNVSDRT